MRTSLLLLVFALPLHAANDGWRETAIDVHEARIDAAHARAASVLQSVGPDAYGREEIPKVRAVLAASTMKRKYDALLGKWRCASTQIGADGVFAYPPFRCEIDLTEDGTLQFAKTSGSQRRHGQLFPFTDHGWVLLGGSTVNDEPIQAYSGTLADTDGESMQFDTVGLAETLSDGRIRIILDAEEDRVEIYTLAR